MLTLELTQEGFHHPPFNLNRVRVYTDIILSCDQIIKYWQWCCIVDLEVAKLHLDSILGLISADRSEDR